MIIKRLLSVSYLVVLILGQAQGATKSITDTRKWLREGQYNQIQGIHESLWHIHAPDGRVEYTMTFIPTMNAYAMFGGIALGGDGAVQGLFHPYAHPFTHNLK